MKFNQLWFSVMECEMLIVGLFFKGLLKSKFHVLN